MYQCFLPEHNLALKWHKVAYHNLPNGFRAFNQSWFLWNTAKVVYRYQHLKHTVDAFQWKLHLKGGKTGCHHFCYILSVINRYAYVCATYVRNNWLNHSKYFTLNFQIKQMKENMAHIRHCVECQLCDKMLQKTFRMYNTQKTETVTKIIQKILTKKETFASNHNGRVHSAVSCINNGPGDHDLFA